MLALNDLDDSVVSELINLKLPMKNAENHEKIVLLQFFHDPQQRLKYANQRKSAHLRLC